MDQPKIPTLKDSQKPQVKIKGLAAGLSLFDRLKQFKKKDLAFILAGLGTLFMAPLAEHFMMAPESGDGTMTQGWGGKGGSNLFGAGGSPYESGITGLAPGGAIGGGGDVITPLNVRDPSALVMGPGSQQQPPAGSLAPQQPPMVSTKEPDLKDALANAAARAAGAATRKAALPVPKPGMTGSGLRGLGVVSGGSSAGAGLAPISATNAPNRAAGSNSLSDVRPLSNYKGVARGPGSGSSGDALKKAAGNAADIFNRGGGSAAGNLETAAAQQMPGGGAFGGAGGGGAGGSDKGPGGNNNGGSKSVGESLDFLRQKSEQEKAIDLKWKMKEKRAMFPLELGQEAAKTAVMEGVVKPLSGMFGDLMKNQFSGTSTIIVCRGNPGGQYRMDQIKGFGPGSCGASGGSNATAPSFYWGGGGDIYACPGGGSPVSRDCYTKTGAAPGDATTSPATGGGADPYSSIGSGGPGYQGQSLTELCTRMRGTQPGFEAGPALNHLKEQAKKLAIAKEAMNGNGATAEITACGGAASDLIVPAGDKIQWRGTDIVTPSIAQRQRTMLTMITGPTGVEYLLSNAATGWRAAVNTALTGIQAQAEAAKNGTPPNFTRIDEDLTKNLNKANTGTDDGSGSSGIKYLIDNPAEVAKLATESAETEALLVRVAATLPAETAIASMPGTTAGQTVDLAAAATQGQGDASIITNLAAIARYQATQYTALRTEQDKYNAPGRAQRAADAFREGQQLAQAATALLAPTGGAQPSTYRTAREAVVREAAKTEPAPAQNPQLGSAGELARGFQTTSGEFNQRVGVTGTVGAGATATGWSAQVLGIMPRNEGAPASEAAPVTETRVDAAAVVTPPCVSTEHHQCP